LDPKRGLTAIVAGSDMLALGCYDAMNELDIRCPNDVSVIGFNDILFCSKFSPPMTSVHVDKFLMGMEAARLILRVVKGDMVSGVSLVMRPRLVVRQSTSTPGIRVPA
ncbi:substrate-binding domain-containing protein, partial [Allopontixanthobacter sp.]|uniref:substrate-binding domain-containing protein n=1 Tax=Allopontixanthobacter sp. TaxID=2906452 RepID=UPI002ABBC8B4